MILRIASRTVSILALVACCGASAAALQDRIDALEEAKKAIAAGNARYAAAFERRDGDAIYDLHEPDAIVHLPGRPIIVGNAVIAGVWNTAFEVGSPMHLRLNTSTVERSGDFATETGTFEITLDKPPARIEGTYFTLWKRPEVGSWKIRCQIWATDVDRAPSPGLAGSLPQQPRK